MAHSLNGYRSAAGWILFTVTVEDGAESIAFAASGFDIELQMPYLVSKVRKGHPETGSGRAVAADGI